MIPKEEVVLRCRIPRSDCNMVGPSFTPKKSKGKQLAVSSEESDIDRSSGLKDILVEPEGVYQYTRTRTGTIAPVDYSLLAREIEVNDDAIVESQSSNSSSEITTFSYMADTHDEVARQFEEQA